MDNTTTGKMTFNPAANAIRALAMDTVQQANSGHPGAPMGMADMAEALWRHHLRHNPNNPDWPDRDRFVLSNGHASTLLYAVLHLSGYDLSIDALKNFRQMGSKTPGHPEFGLTPGVETTTGPLGQGITNAVGMALAEKVLAAQFNRPGFAVIDHRTWAFVGDGCLMEGISHEAASLAATWKLNKLVVLYDANGISIDGNIKGWFTDDTGLRFKSYGWNVIGPIDGHDGAALDAAINLAKKERERPSFIICTTVIGCGSPNKGGTADVHGSPLGAAEITACRTHIGWNHPPFEIPVDIARAWDGRERGAELQRSWEALLAGYRQAYPDLGRELDRRLGGTLPEAFGGGQPLIEAMRGLEKGIASRKASELCLELMMADLPELIGGSADLACSNLTDTKHSRDIVDHGDGNRISFGVREFGMCAIANGIALHGGFRPFVATFMVFSDYARNAIRMAALMGLPLVYVFTHDSIGLGEDGPTHQPIEHLPSLRLMPNLKVWRPCDAVETAAAWSQALRETNTPSVLALSRQNLSPQFRDARQEADIAKGAYVLADATDPQAVIIATGSEVGLAMAAKAACEKEAIRVRVVSMVCAEQFAAQGQDYQEAVLPAHLPRVAVEAAHSHYWKGWVGLDGAVIGIDIFGESAPAAKLFPHFGITAERVIAAVQRVAKR